MWDSQIQFLVKKRYIRVRTRKFTIDYQIISFMPYLLTIARIFFISVAFISTGQSQKVNIKTEYAETLMQLTNALVKRQVISGIDAGAIQCEHCHVLHTRAAEAMYPFAVVYGIKKDKHYLEAAKSAANWLMRQQQPDGSWKETPEEWTGNNYGSAVDDAIKF